MTKKEQKSGAENLENKEIDQITDEVVEKFNETGDLVKYEAKDVLGTRDFRAFLEDNPEVNKYILSRREAIQVGDQITLPMWKFASWINKDKHLSAQEDEKTIKQNLKGAVFKSVNAEIGIDDPVTITINKIDETDILLSGGGIQKKVDASLFYNYHKPQDTTSTKMFFGGNLVGTGDVVAHDGSVHSHGERSK